MKRGQGSGVRRALGEHTLLLQVKWSRQSPLPGWRSWSPPGPPSSLQKHKDTVPDHVGGLQDPATRGTIEAGSCPWGIGGITENNRRVTAPLGANESVSPASEMGGAWRGTRGTSLSPGTEPDGSLKDWLGPVGRQPADQHVETLVGT
ncbi:hypothetical protein EYF80_042753 [Liparis tanakae]|uniref:Uncharacterized protein n=1 Tax=Liparis tanakae TaxID=230148 RepID=A0A4Z2G0N8_9TELE|nr:hypothetical protein EYF80_042753 [Liparis tanakae]